MRVYSYVGREIDIEVRTQLVVVDAILFDTKITEEHQLALGMKPTISTPAGGVIEPTDAFDFFKNLRATPPQARALTLALAAVRGVVSADLDHQESRPRGPLGGPAPPSGLRRPGARGARRRLRVR
jgi:hypothetical protein